MAYEIINGKIKTEVCTISVAHHCNISCRSCTHLSPRAKKVLVDPGSVLRDLSALARYYHPKRVSLLGGEPLLHPGLLDVVDAVRQSAVSEQIRVVTNGTLLGRMPERFWQAVDEVYISLYPDSAVGIEDLRSYSRQAREHGVSLEVRYLNNFCETYSELGTADERLIGRIFATCRVVKLWHCHSHCDGHLYRCPQSAFIPRYLLGKSGSEAATDGFEVSDAEDSRDKLMEFLTSERPLHSCRYCLGSVGKRFVHEQEPHGLERCPRTTEELVDWHYLERLERSPTLDITPWLVRSCELAKRALALMPPAVRLHPVVRWGATAVRNMHRALH